LSWHGSSPFMSARLSAGSERIALVESERAQSATPRILRSELLPHLMLPVALGLRVLPRDSKIPYETR
jgi:hypothetical protein